MMGGVEDIFFMRKKYDLTIFIIFRSNLAEL